MRCDGCWMPTIVACVIACDLACIAGATGLRIEASPGRAALETRVRVSWDNSWRNSRNWDAAWLVVKARANGRGPWRAARVVGIAATSNDVEVRPASDRSGLFVHPASAHRGTLKAELDVTVEAISGLRESDSVDYAAFGVEMVYIPAGPYYLGDPSELARSYGSLARPAGELAAARAGGGDRLLRVESEAEIAIGTHVDYINTTQRQYEGDRAGTLPVAFPKGTAAFYIMKYEISQGEYAAFLNGIHPSGANFRAIHASHRYHQLRGTITFDNDSYRAADPVRPCNFIGWDDGCAFLDWMAMRPMTELEFTKACRGPDRPIEDDFPWGTADKQHLGRIVDFASGRLTLSAAEDEARLSDATRIEFGASHYWVMDLAGSLWEKCISIGHQKGREFRGTHGDGNLGEYGFANVPDWPRGDLEGGGYGYRGGGAYEASSTPDVHVPHSPVEFRRYGGWGQGPRSVAYGMRGVRTAEAVSAP